MPPDKRPPWLHELGISRLEEPLLSIDNARVFVKNVATFIGEGRVSIFDHWVLLIDEVEGLNALYPREDISTVEVIKRDNHADEIV